jgi:hypothetical protein
LHTDDRSGHRADFTFDRSKTALDLIEARAHVLAQLRELLQPILPDDLISISGLAREQRKRKQTLFKIVKRLGIEPRNARSSSNGARLISTSPERKLTRHDTDELTPQLKCRRRRVGGGSC